MPRTSFQTVDEYLAAQPDEARVVLEHVRSAIRKALPNADEVISYKIPAYRLQGGIVLYFAGWKRHYSLYPADDRIIAAFGNQLASYKAGKGTIQFPLSEPVPAKLIERIARFRAKDAVQQGKATAAAVRKSIDRL